MTREFLQGTHFIQVVLIKLLEFAVNGLLLRKSLGPWMFLHVYMCLWALNTFRPVAETGTMAWQTLHQWCQGTGSLREWQWP